MLAYNKAKKGVDMLDQLSSYYSPFRKTRYWYKKLAFEVNIGTTVVNIWVLFRKYYPEKAMSTQEFRESLVLSLTNHPPQEVLKSGRNPPAASALEQDKQRRA